MKLPCRHLVIENMEEENKLILYGMWASLYSKRVEIALKLKGTSYDYVEEDLMNKSPSLLMYNPIYKKVPVLLHNGKAIAESLFIVEYIDETWKDGPRILPQDPYRRAKVRFWVNFLQQELFEALALVARTEGDIQEKAIEELREKLKVLEEEGVKDIYPDGIPAFDKDNLGFIDIVVVSLFGPYTVHQEVLGIKTLDAEKTPVIVSWIEAIKEVPLISEIIPPNEKLAAAFKFVRQNALTSAAN